MPAPGLPDQIPPQGTPFVYVDDSGTLRVDEDWYLFFYSLWAAVIGQFGGVALIEAVNIPMIDLDAATTDVAGLPRAIANAAVSQPDQPDAAPTYRDLSNALVLAYDALLQDPATPSGGGLTAIANNTLLANTSGSTAVPISTTVSALLDAALGSTQGMLVTRNAGGWTVLGPSTGGNFLQENGAGANLAWAAGGFTNPMTTLGDIITGGAAGAPGRVAVGGSGDALGPVGGVPVWHDPNYENVLFLTDGTAFTDLSASGRTITLSTSPPTIVGGAWSFAKASTQWAQLASNDEYKFGSDPFCIEADVNPTALSPGEARIVCATSQTGATRGGFYIYVQDDAHGTGNGWVLFQVFDGGGAFSTICNITTGVATITHGASNKIACSRSKSGIYRVFNNGVLLASSGSATSASQSMGSAITGLSIGVDGSNSTSNPFDGTIKNLRITRGYARRVKAYTPAPAAFPVN